MKCSTKPLGDEKKQQIIHILDRDVFLTIVYNDQHNIFEKISSLNVNHYLSLESEWLKFNKKGSVNNDKIKKDFKLFNKDCIGFNGEDYCVFRDIKSG